MNLMGKPNSPLQSSPIRFKASLLIHLKPSCASPTSVALKGTLWSLLIPASYVKVRALDIRIMPPMLILWVGPTGTKKKLSKMLSESCSDGSEFIQAGIHLCQFAQSCPSIRHDCGYTSVQNLFGLTWEDGLGSVTSIVDQNSISCW